MKIEAKTKSGKVVELFFNEKGRGIRNSYKLINEDNFNYAPPYANNSNGFDDFNVNGEIVRKYFPTQLASGKVIRQFTSL